MTGNLQGTSKRNEAPNPIKIVHYSFKDFCFENIWTQSVTEALSQIFPFYLFFDRDTVIVSHYLDFWWPLCSWKNSVLLVLTFLADIVKTGKETIETVSHEKISMSKETRPAQWCGKSTFQYVEKVRIAELRKENSYKAISVKCFSVKIIHLHRRL